MWPRSDRRAAARCQRRRRSSPNVASSGTNAAAAVDWCASARARSSRRAADLRIGHMKSRRGFERRCELRDPRHEDSVGGARDSGDTFEMAFTVTNPYDCTLSGVRLVDDVTTEAPHASTSRPRNRRHERHEGPRADEGEGDWANLGDIAPTEPKSSRPSRPRGAGDRRHRDHDGDAQRVALTPAERRWRRTRSRGMGVGNERRGPCPHRRDQVAARSLSAGVCLARERRSAFGNRLPRILVGAAPPNGVLPPDALEYTSERRARAASSGPCLFFQAATSNAEARRPCRGSGCSPG